MQVSAVVTLADVAEARALMPLAWPSQTSLAEHGR